MSRALTLAQEAAAANEVPVGAVIVCGDTGTIIAEGRNSQIARHDPTAHAEIIAIRNAAARLGNYRLTGLWLYVTLEPCAMCAGAISIARLGRVIFAADDRKGGAIINGPKIFAQPTCHWRPDYEQDHANADRAAQLLKAFFAARR